MKKDSNMTRPDLPVLTFASAGEFNSWLSEHQKASPGIWIRLYNVRSGIPSITYEEALETALCFGWIDGQKKAFDKESWLQKFSPRRPKSIWSKRNRQIVERLYASGMMKPQGIIEVESAKADGRWERVYDSPGNMIVPSDFLDELAKNKEAEAFFKTLNKTNVYSIVWRLQTAKKPETRNKRIQSILEMLKQGKKFH